MTGLQWLLIIVAVGVIANLVQLCRRHFKSGADPKKNTGKPVTDDELRAMIRDRIMPPNQEALDLEDAVLAAALRLDVLLGSTLTAALAEGRYGNEKDIEHAVDKLLSALHLSRVVGELPRYERTCVLNALDELRSIVGMEYGNEERAEILECAARLVKAKHALHLLKKDGI